MQSTTLDARCDAIRAVWNCSSLEDAHALVEDKGMKVLTLENFIATSFRPSAKHIDTIDPKTGRSFAQVPVSSADEVETAVRNATEAFKTWSKTTAAVRSQYLRRIAQLIQDNRELFAIWESIDQGKTIARARIEVDRAISNFK